MKPTLLSIIAFGYWFRKPMLKLRITEYCFCLLDPIVKVKKPKHWNPKAMLRETKTNTRGTNTNIRETNTNIRETNTNIRETKTNKNMHVGLRHQS